VGWAVLQVNEVYLVEVVDTTVNAAAYRQITRNTSLLLPDSLIPTDGQTHTFNWTVRVAAPNAEGVYRTIGGVAGRAPVESRQPPSPDIIRMTLIYAHVVFTSLWLSFFKRPFEKLLFPVCGTTYVVPA
jgi:hypothetical protein